MSYPVRLRRRRGAAYGGGTPAVVQRYLTKLSATLSQYYSIPTWTAAGDFEIEMDVAPSAFPGAGLYSAFIGKQVSTLERFTIGVNDDGTIRAHAPGKSAILNSSQPIELSKITSISVSRSGSTLTILNKNNGDTTSGTFTSDDLIVDTHGQHLNANYFNGYLANVSLTESGGDNRSYALDENFGDTTVAVDSVGGNNGTAVNIVESELFTDVGDALLGVELLSLSADAYFAAQEQSMIDVGGVSGRNLIKTNSGTATGIQWVSILTAGYRYRTSLVILENNSGALNIGDQLPSISDAGSFQGDFTSPGANYYVKRQSGITDITTESHSCRRLLEYA